MFVDKPIWIRDICGRLKPQNGFKLCSCQKSFDTQQKRFVQHYTSRRFLSTSGKFYVGSVNRGSLLLGHGGIGSATRSYIATLRLVAWSFPSKWTDFSHLNEANMGKQLSAVSEKKYRTTNSDFPEPERLLTHMNNFFSVHITDFLCQTASLTYLKWSEFVENIAGGYIHDSTKMDKTTGYFQARSHSHV